MTVRAIVFGMVALLITAAPVGAGEYSNANMSLTLPKKWAVDTYPYKYKTPTVTFARDGDDYPLAMVWTLSPGVKLADRDLVTIIDGEPDARRSVSRDVTIQRNGRTGRRIDFSSFAHSDTHLHSAIVIDRGGQAPMIVLDVVYTDRTMTDCDGGPCPAERARQLHKEIEDLLASFKAAPG